MLQTCPECRDERYFDQPPCLDGHGPDCPEWACRDCGAALLIGAAPPTEPAPDPYEQAAA